MHRWCHITAVCLTILVRIQMATEEGCDLSNEELSKRHIREIDALTHLNFSDTINLTCQSGYGLFMLPTKSKNVKFHWPSNDTIPDQLIVSCNGERGKRGDLVFKYSSTDCNDDICDGFCKKYFTKNEIITNMDQININLNLPPKRDIFWSGEVLNSANCKDYYFLRRRNTRRRQKANNSYRLKVNFKIKLKKCAHKNDCDSSFEDTNWVEENECVQPTCDKIYAENLLNMKFTNQTASFIPGRSYKYQCNDDFTLGINRKVGELDCVFNQSSLTASWNNIYTKFSDLQCDKYCLLQSSSMKNALSLANYQIAHEKENRIEVRHNEKFWVKCKSGYIHEGDTEDEIIEPFEVTCMKDIEFKETHKCQDGLCVKPPNEHLFKVKEQLNTGKADCLDGYSNRDNNNTHIFVICYNNQWKPAKIKGETMECTKTPKDCSLTWEDLPAHGIDVKIVGKTVQHEETVNLNCFKGFEDVYFGQNMLYNVRCIDGVLMQNNQEARCYPRKCRNGYPKNKHIIIKKGLGEARTSEYKCQSGYSRPANSTKGAQSVDNQHVWMFCIDGIDKWEGGCIPTECSKKPNALTFDLSELWPPEPSDIDFGGDASQLSNDNFNAKRTTGMFCCRHSYGRKNSDNRFHNYLDNLGLSHLLPFYNFNRRCIMLKCVDNDWFPMEDDDVCIEDDPSQSVRCNLRESHKNNVLTIDLHGKEHEETLLKCKTGYKPPLDGRIICHVKTQLYHTSQCVKNANSTNSKTLTECISPGCQPNVCNNDPPDNENIHMHTGQVAQSGFFQCREGYAPNFRNDAMIMKGLFNVHINEAYGLCLSNGKWTFQNNCYKMCEIKADGIRILKSIPPTAQYATINVNRSYCNEGFQPNGMTEENAEYICRNDYFYEVIKNLPVLSDNFCVPSDDCAFVPKKKLNISDNRESKDGTYTCIKNYATREGTNSFNIIDIMCIEGEWREKDQCLPMCPSIPNGTIIGETFDSNHKTEYREGFSGMLYCNPPDLYCEYVVAPLSARIAKVVCENGKFQAFQNQSQFIAECNCFNITNSSRNQCFDEPDPSIYHTIDGSHGSTNINSLISRQCNQEAGYYSADHNTPYILLTCINSKWQLYDSPHNKCVRICKPLSNDTIKYMTDLSTNLEMDHLDSMFYHGVELNVTCQPGYSILNKYQSAIILCQDGYWLIDDISLIDPCEKSICDNYPNGEEFHVTRDSKETGYFTCYNEYAPHYEKQSNSIILLCQMNKWYLSSQYDKCYKKCKETSEVHVIHDDYVRHGELVNVKCRLNEMQLVGGSLARCHDGILMHVNDESQPMSYDKLKKVCKPAPCYGDNCQPDVQDDQTPIERKEETFFDHDWAIPVVVASCLLLIILVAMAVCMFRRCRNKNKSLENHHHKMEYDDDMTSDHLLSGYEETSDATTSAKSLSSAKLRSGERSYSETPSHDAVTVSLTND